MKLQKRILQLPVYAGILTTILVVPALADPVNIAKVLTLTIAGLSCLILLGKQLSKEFLNSNVHVISLTLFFIIALLSATIQSDQTLYRSILGAWGRNNGLLSYLALAIIFLYIATSKSKELIIFMVKSLTALGIFGVVYGFLQLANADPISWVHSGNKMILTLGNSNFASALLGLTGISTLINIFGFNNKRWLNTVYFISYLLQLYLTKESDALQGLLILLLGSFLVIGSRLRFSAIMKFKRISIAWWGLGLILGAIGTFGIFGNGPLSKLLSPSFSSLHDRYYHWVAAFRMLKANLFSGVGIDAFGDSYRQFRLIEAIELRGNASSGTNNAHNVFMQLGATGGLPLLISYLALTVFIGYRAYKSIRYMDDKFIVSATFALWLSFQVQSFVSIDQIGLTIWGWIIGACIVGVSYTENSVPEVGKSKSNYSNLRIKTTQLRRLTLVSLILMGLLPIFMVSNNLYKSGMLKNHINSLITSQSVSEVEVNRNSKLLFDFSLTLSEPETRLTAINMLLRANAVELALTLSEDTARKFPKHYYAWDQVALIYEGTNRKRLAIPARLKMIEIDPLNMDLKKVLQEDRA
ncbi:RfaL Lipid A core - O-antigen ligase and related enzymes [actinobacterium SCGC AAA044-D11]